MTETLPPDSVPGTASNAHEILDNARVLVEPAYRETVGELPATVRTVVGYHIGWWDADGTPRRTAGKALRPALTLRCAAAAGMDEPAAAIPAAVAVELVHDFSLLHDDVMDADPTRRHRPAAWTQFGVGLAVLAGDALLTEAVRLAASGPRGGPAALIIADVLRDLCRGQAADIAFEGRDEIGLDECVDMAAGKTGALLGAACRLGALAAGADAVTAESYLRFGRDLGLAFQLVDDLLGIWGDPQATGKPVGADLAARKKSLPVTAALASGTPAGEHLRTLLRGREPFDPAAVRLAASLVEDAGGRAWAEHEAARRVDAAITALTAARPRPEPAADLRTLARFFTERDR